MRSDVGEKVPFTERKCGIYRIWNTKNNRSYIGQSVDVYRRIKKHFWDNKNNNSVLASEMSNFPLSDFEWEILEFCSPEVRYERERFYIEQFGSWVDGKNHGYNLSIGGHGNFRYSPSEKTRKIFRDNNLKGKSHFARKVICDGVVYDCAKSFAEANDIKYHLVKDWLSGKNGTPPEWFDKGLSYIDGNNKLYKSTSKAKKIIYKNILYKSEREFCLKNNINRELFRSAKAKNELNKIIDIEVFSYI